MKKTYWEKLKDPRWQKKRLEAMQAAEFTCQVCMDQESTLHVHHKQYFKGREPWEYEVAQLSVLCEGCHEYQHKSEDAYNLVGSYLDLDGPRDRDTAACVVAGFTGGTCPDDVFDPFAYMCGLIAKKIMSVSTNYYDLIAVSDFSERDPKALFAGMVSISKADVSGSNL